MDLCCSTPECRATFWRWLSLLKCGHEVFPLVRRWYFLLYLRLLHCRHTATATSGEATPSSDVADGEFCYLYDDFWSIAEGFKVGLLCSDAGFQLIGLVQLGL